MSDQIQSQRPVVLIGLGGTGKQTLLYLRRMFLDRYGAKTLPHVAMVVIDADGRQQNLDGSVYDEFDREVAFDDELIVTPVNEALNNVRNNRSQYPHIGGWLDPELDKFGDISDGAGQIRSLGRLAFFRHYPAIKDAFYRAFDSVTNATATDVSLQKYNIAIDRSQGVDSWLIFSVAGGTGSGMFLDAAFLAKQEGSFVDGSKPRALILLPTAFNGNPPQGISSADNHRVFANGYAALTELESYNYSQNPTAAEPEASVRTKFQVQWTRAQFDQAQRATIDGPVFENAWLVDSEPRDGGGQASGDGMSLCHMMAEWLFLQYSSVAPALGGAIRSNRSNHGKVITTLAQVNVASADRQGEGPDERPVVQQLLYSKRYSGFGLSKIYVPTMNLANQAYAKLVGDIVTLWLTDDKKSDVRAAIQRTLYPQIHLPMNGATQGFTDALGRRLSVDGAKQSLTRRFERLIDDEQNKLKARGFEPGSETEARDWFTFEVMTKLLYADEAVLSKRGEISRIVQPDNVRDALGEIRAALDQFVSDALATPGRRIGFAEEALRMTLRDYQQAAQQADTRLQREQKKGERLQREIDELLRWAGDHRGFDRETIFKAAFAKMNERAQSEFRRQVYLATQAVANDAANFIGTGRKIKDADGKERVVDTGLLSTLVQLRGTFNALLNRSSERIAALRRQPTSSLNCRAPAIVTGEGQGGDAELQALYKTENNQDISGQEIAHHEERLYLALAHKNFTSPWYLRDKSDAGLMEAVFRDLLDFARGELSYLPGRMQDALLCLSKKFDKEKIAGQFEAELDKVVDRGSPWLPRPTQNAGGDDQFNNLVPEKYIAVAAEAAAEPRKAALVAAGAIDTNGVALKNGRAVKAGPLDAVYIESEVAGVPLFAVRYMDLYRNAYLGYIDSSDAARGVHIELDLEKYTELMPPTEREFRHRQEAVSAFIRGVVSGVLLPDTASQSQTDPPGWRFFEKNAMSVRPVERRLGRYTSAVRLLARGDRTLYSALQRELAARDASYSEDDLARIYCAIDAMDGQPPVTASEWQRAMVNVLGDMRRKYGDSIVGRAREAEANAPSWLDSIKNRSRYPFLRVKSLGPGS